MGNGYSNEPAFIWWVREVLKKCDRHVNKVKSRYWNNKFKFGVEVPLKVEDSLRIDLQNGNTLWHDSIGKYTKNSRFTFNFLEREDHAPVGYKKITCHLIFNVKTNLTSKSRYVAGGHITDTPFYVTYVSVASRDSVRLAFLIVALNDLDILAGDIHKAFLNAPTKDKVFFYAGDEWKSDQWKVVIIVRALYDIKYSCFAWRNHFSDILGNHLGLQSSLADPDLLFKAGTDKTRNKHYTYIPVYVDNLIIVDKGPLKYMAMLESS